MGKHGGNYLFRVPPEVEGVLCRELRPRLQAHDVALGELGHVQAVHLLKSSAKKQGGKISNKYFLL